MNTATIAGVASTLMFAGSTLPMVVRAARTRDVSSYSRSHLFMTNAGNAVHTVYVASLPPGPVWLLHCMYSGVSAFMFAAHLRWARPSSTAGSRLESPGGTAFDNTTRQKGSIPRLHRHSTVTEDAALRVHPDMAAGRLKR